MSQKTIVQRRFEIDTEGFKMRTISDEEEQELIRQQIENYYRKKEIDN